jgi:hypothetical protein
VLAVEHLPHDEQRPPLTHQLERTGDGALAGPTALHGSDRTGAGLAREERPLRLAGTSCDARPPRGARLALAPAVIGRAAGVASGHTAVATIGSSVREAGEEAGHRRQLGVTRTSER